METSGPTDTRFAGQIGSYLSTTAGDLSHTQDFISDDQIVVDQPQGTTSTSGQLSYSIQRLLGSRINAATIFQNYTINKVEVVIAVRNRYDNLDFGSFDYTFAIASWNRSPFGGASKINWWLSS